MSVKVENVKPTRFIHLRPRDLNGNILPSGGLCIAFDTIEDGGQEDVFCAFARCSKYDVYNKARAREIAEGRLNKWLATRNPKLTIIRLNGRKPRKAIMDVVREVGSQSKAVLRATHVDRNLAAAAAEVVND